MYARLHLHVRVVERVEDLLQLLDNLPVLVPLPKVALEAVVLLNAHISIAAVPNRASNAHLGNVLRLRVVPLDDIPVRVADLKALHAPHQSPHPLTQDPVRTCSVSNLSVICAIVSPFFISSCARAHATSCRTTLWSFQLI